MKVLKTSIIAALLTVGVVPASAETTASTPDVATLLFGNPQWHDAPPGTTITYAYSKKVDPEFGRSFNDTVKIKVDKGETPDARTVELHLFTGENTRASGPVESDEQNPVLIFALQVNLQDVMKIFGIPNPRYLRNAVRAAWRDDAKIEKVDIDVGGKKVPGTSITVMPYVNDPQKDQMKGLDRMVYTVEISDQVPGEIAKIDIHAPAQGKPLFSEVLSYQSGIKP